MSNEVDEELRAFAMNEAMAAHDPLAEYLFARACKIDIGLVDNQYESIVFWMEFAGRTVSAKWDDSDRFEDPDVIYGILFQLLLDAQDTPVKVEAKHEPMAFVFSDDEMGE